MSGATTEVVDEAWRGGYATAASRRKMLSACSWGNGVRWDRAAGRVGHWVRIYPHTLLVNDDQVIKYFFNIYINAVACYFRDTPILFCIYKQNLLFHIAPETSYILLPH